MHTLFWHDNILFLDNGTAYGVYRLPALPYENQPEAVKRSIYRQLEVFFQTYRGNGQILSIAVPIPAEEVTSRMAAFSKHPHWRAHMELVAEQLREHPSFERRTFLILPLASPLAAAWSQVLDRPDRIRERVADQFLRFWGYTKRKVARVGSPVLTRHDIEAAAHAELRTFNRLQAVISALMRATPHELELLHRAPYHRGLAPWPVVLPDPLPRTVTIEGGEVVIRPRPLRLALASASVREDTFRIRVEHSDKRVSYQSVMAAASLPERLETIGDEWLYLPLEKLNFPVDACVHFEILSPQRAREIVYRRKKIVAAQGEEYAQAGDVPWDIYDGLEDAQALEAKLKAGMAFAVFHAFFAVAADSELEMLRREEQLKEKLQGAIQLVHPPGDALKIWQAFFPGQSGGVDKAWSIPADPTMLAASGALGTAQVGDQAGMWFAKMAHSGRPVWVDWFRAMRELNRSGAAAFVGTLGSGKSVGMKYGADTMLQWGAIGAITDPKQGEYGALVGLWPKESVWWTFGAGSDLRFSPFRLGRDARESRLIAEGFLGVLLNVTTRREDQRASLVLQRALAALYEGEKWDMDHFLLCLDAERRDEQRREEERDIADLFLGLLEHYRDGETGRALFGKDGEDNVMDDRARLVVASIMGLEFPDPGSVPDAWRDSQRFAVAILYLVTQIAFRRLVMAPQSVKKFFAVDEAWILRSVPEGRALLNRMLLLGRSMNLVLMMAVQNPDVLLPREGSENDDVSASLGWCFVGRITSRTQVQHAVRLLGLPLEDEGDLNHYVEVFQAFEKGRGFLRDPLGRIGEVQIDVVDEGLLRAFSTTPE
ncbi:ATP-binding protein [Alicyclobacillus macrosporangiidus]|uniref:ATP-binding protein n=1 Tax=Alicyclobacillus macrosporangiidus TaxID=392015 RepID=UPI000496499A|nr:ATP-binding protein [Alicyclobacillus macrosporangiidus]